MKRQIILQPGDKLLHLGQRPPRVVKWLLVEQVAALLVYAFADGPAWVRELLAASGGSTLARLQLYQPFTAPWLHLSSRELIFNALLLWLVGSALERWWGGRRFLLFWVATAVLGIWAGVGVGLLQPAVLLSGSSGATAAILVAAAVIFPRHLLFIHKGVLPLRARAAMLGMAGFLVIGNLVAGAYLVVAVQVGGGVAAVLFLLRRTRSRRKFGVIEGGKGKGGEGEEGKGKGKGKGTDEPEYWN